MFELQDRTLNLRQEVRTKGAVYSLEALESACPNMLLAGVNNKLQVYQWENLSVATSRGLIARSEHCGHILVLYIAARGDTILVGDLMKSIAVLRLDPDTCRLIELARDLNSNWMTAISFLGEDSYLGAESALNLFVARRNSRAASNDERQRLEVVGEFHLGEFVNRFRRGSLTMQAVDAAEPALPTLLFGTAMGMIGVIVSLSQQLYKFLLKVQANLVRVIKGVGGFSHSEWRTFNHERKASDASGFIDGDLIEGYLELSADQKLRVVNGLDVTVDHLTSTILELRRLHS